MAHFACISVALPGHINPMVALARELIERGHRATFFHLAGSASMLPRDGVGFVPLRGASDEVLHALLRDAGRVSGLLGITRLVEHFAAMTAILCRHLPEALRGQGVDMILTDQLEPAGALVGYRLGLPFVTLAAALPINWEVGIPSAFIGWDYGESRFHRARNIGSTFGTRKIMNPISAVIETVSREWNICRGRQIEDYASGYAQICQLTPSLDFPRQALSRCFHYCGPLRWPIRSTPNGSVERKPRAYVSLGSLQGHRERLFATIAEAARSNRLEVVLAHGGRLAPEAAARLGRVADVHAFVDQHEVLSGCEIAVLNGGLNTVLDALALGVPVVVVPLAYEQGAIASRVVRSGAGVACRGASFRRLRLVRHLRTVRSEPSYAQAATRIARDIRTAGGARRAADIVEQVFAFRSPVFASDTT